eukprot:jgi/Chlat1/8774/Chrsp90S00679
MSALDLRAVADGQDGEQYPAEARAVARIMLSMGASTCEPRVLPQLMEFLYRYEGDIVSEAAALAEHAGKSGPVDTDDVKLAVQSRLQFAFAQPPPREVMMELAQQRNSVPLPPLNTKPGIPLPPEQFTLTAPNYQAFPRK